MPGKFEVKKSGSKFRWILWSQNGREIVKSPTYATRSQCKQAIVSAQNAAKKAKINDLTTSTSTSKSAKSKAKTKKSASAKKAVAKKSSAKKTGAVAKKKTKARTAKSGPVRKQQRSTTVRRKTRSRSRA